MAAGTPTPASACAWAICSPRHVACAWAPLAIASSACTTGGAVRTVVLGMFVVAEQRHAQVRQEGEWA